MHRTLKIIMIFILAGTLCGYKLRSQNKSQKEKQTPPKGASTGAPAGAAQKMSPTIMSKSVELKKFVGETAINVDTTCRPDQCNNKCVSACQTISQECRAAVDVGQECLAAHRPKKKPHNAAELMGAINDCLQKNKKEFERYRCTFSTSDLDYRLFVVAEKGPACQSAFTNYQTCLSEGSPELASVQNCQVKFRPLFEKSACILVTKENARRPYNEATADELKCYISCQEFPK